MGLADNAARAKGEKVVVKPTTAQPTAPKPTVNTTTLAGVNAASKPAPKPTGPVVADRVTTDKVTFAPKPAATTSNSSPTVTPTGNAEVPGVREVGNFLIGENISNAMRGEASWNAVTPMDVAVLGATAITGGYGAVLGTAAKAANVASKAAKVVAPTAAKAVTPTAARAVLPKVGGPSLSVAQSGAAAVSRPTLSAAAGLSNMAADVKSAASFIKNNTVARNAAAFTGTLAAGGAAVGVKDFIGGITSSTAAPTQRPTTTGGATPAPTSIDAGKVSTPADVVVRPTSTGGSTAAPTSIGGSSLPADTVVKPTVTGTPTNVGTGSSTGTTTGTATGSTTGTTTGSAADATAGAGAVNVPGSIPVPIGSTNTNVGSTTGSTTQTNTNTRAESVARDEVLSPRQPRSNPRLRLRVPNLPDINGSPVAQGSVQSDWQDFRGTSSVAYKQSASSGPSTATFAVSGKDKGEKNSAPTEDKGAKAENPTSTRPTATTGRRSGWQYSESAG